MRLEQLEYIVEIARTGSISMTAERLHLSQPNISQSIAALEEELGITIFKRSRTGSKLTEAGESILPLAVEVLERVEEIKEIAKVESTLLTGRLTIAAIPTICISLLPRSLALFKEKYPGVHVEIIEEESNQIINDVQQEKADLGLIGLPITKKLESKQLVLEHFMNSKIMACVGKNSELTRKKSLLLKEVIQYPVLSSSKYVIKTLSQYGQPNLFFESKNIEAAKRVIAEGMAIGFYTDVSLKHDPYVQMGEIIPIPINEPLEINFSYVHLKNREHTARQEFLKILKKQLIHFERIY